LHPFFDDVMHSIINIVIKISYNNTINSQIVYHR